MNKIAKSSVLGIVKRVIILSLIILILAFSAANAFLHPEGGIDKSSAADQVPARLIVKFKDLPATAKAGEKLDPGKYNLESVSTLNKVYGVNSFSMFGNQASPSVVSKKFNNVYILKPADNVDLEAMAREYSDMPNVEYAEPDYMVELHSAIPSDVFYGQQWGLNNTGQWHYEIDRRFGDENDKLVVTYGLPDADIDADEVFQNPPDKTVVSVVAVIDTGVDLDHPDLSSSIWVNTRENPYNDIDDDHNGYVNDYVGWDFSASDDVINIDLQDNNPTDYFGHGTHCAGIIAGITNNGIGIAGVSNCKIMPLKIFPYPLISKVAEALIYAADNGADVVSMSFGYPYRSFLMEEALNYARSKGVVLCASTGNTSKEEANYPGASDYTISIGASDDSDRVTDFSTYGDFMDVVAPGEGVLSLRADSTDMYSDHGEPNVHVFNDIYYISSGTSMSCPHVAGVAGYIRSKSAGLSVDEVTRIIRETAEDYIDPYGDGRNLPGWDKYSGYGRVSLYNALQETPSVHARIERPYANEILSGQVDIWGRAFESQSILTNYTIDIGKGKLPDTWQNIINDNTWVEYDRLGTWNTQGLSGHYTLRLKVGENNFHLRSVFIANEAFARIDYPQTGDTIFNFANIYATSYAPDFESMLLEYGAGKNPTQFHELATVTSPLEDEIVTDWIVEVLPEGEYTLRISTITADGIAYQDESHVYVRSLFTSDNAWKSHVGNSSSMIANYGDFNNDGFNDIIVGTTESIEIFDTDGNRTTSVFGEFPNNNYVSPPAVGDINGDGIDDFVAVGGAPPELIIYPSGEDIRRHSMDFKFFDASFTGLENDFPKVFLNDVDNDGADEIHLLQYDNNASSLFILRATGDTLLMLRDIGDFITVDIDGDDISELFVYSKNDRYIKQMTISGEVLDSVYFELENQDFFEVLTFSAYDIDNDGLLELIAFGQFYGSGYWMYVFDDGLNVKDGWPRDLTLPDYLAPSTPIFADLNDDGQAEYMCSYFGISYSYIHVWNPDGTPYLGDSPQGLFATIPRPGVLNMLTVADINGDDNLDIIACATDDLFFTYLSQRIYAWDLRGKLIDKFPLIVTPANPILYYSDFRFTPLLGDLDEDGFIDITMPTSDSSLAFVDFDNVLYSECMAPVPMWRYNRKLNNIAEPVSCLPTDVTDDESLYVLPDQYALEQNYPNPFNPQTRIDYSLPERSDVRISIYNILGQNIRTIVNKSQVAGSYSVTWDGTNKSGQEVASGIYFYKITAGDFSASKKMMLVR